MILAEFFLVVLTEPNDDVYDNDGCDADGCNDDNKGCNDDDDKNGQ